MVTENRKIVRDDGGSMTLGFSVYRQFDKSNFDINRQSYTDYAEPPLEFYVDALDKRILYDFIHTMFFGYDYILLNEIIYSKADSTLTLKGYGVSIELTVAHRSDWDSRDDYITADIQTESIKHPLVQRLMQHPCLADI